MKKNILILLSARMLASCGGNSFDVDVSGIDASIDIERFDLDFDTIAPQNIQYSLNALTEKYGDFAEFYTDGIIGIGTVETPTLANAYSDFSNYCKSNGIFDDVQKQFPDLNSLESIMAQGAKHFKYYFPNDTLPKLYTVVSGFQESMFPTEGIIAVSLDKYLGNAYPHYESLGIEVYKRRRMIPEMIPADYFRCIAMLNYPKDEKAAFNILNEMIYEGRIQYFLNCMLPETPDSTRWGYTDFQYRWAEYYEEEIWDYLVDKKMLFDTNPIAVRNFTGEGPFTNAFGNNSAPGCASYCGYRIVCSYMRHNPDVTLKDLMEIKDMNQIYNKARYNP